MKDQIVKLKNLKIAPRKVRLLADVIRGLSVNEAEAKLTMLTNRGTGPLLKLLRSAVSNVKNNQKENADNLFIKSVMVDGGMILKRSLPRAQGRATLIQKKMSHVTITLSEKKGMKSRFNIIVEKKNKEEKKPAKTEEPKKKIEKEEKKDVKMTQEKTKDGVFKKMFRRKSV